jgi:hypothetical protein
MATPFNEGIDADFVRQRTIFVAAHGRRRVAAIRSIMPEKTMPRGVLSRLLAVLILIPLLGSPVIGAPADDTTGPYLRAKDEHGRVFTLEIATRRFVPGEHDRPIVALVGVAHVADGLFFREVNDLLKEYDIVLYEAVRPAGTGGTGGDTPEERTQSTEQAMRFIASVIESHHKAKEQYPRDLAELRTFAAVMDPILVNWLKAAAIDAWGGTLVYEVAEDGENFTLSSLGADGEPGGDGEDADIIITRESNIAPLALDGGHIQKQLADALGLAYQLHALPYGSPNWRPSDMTIDQLAAAFTEQGLDVAAFSDNLTGSAFPAKLAGLLLRLIAVLDAFAEGAVSDLLKVMLIDLLGDAKTVEKGLAELGPGVVEVLIDRRNQVVIDDIAVLIDRESEVRSVAILYGAGHMDDLERRLREQLGYVADETEAGDRWLSAITVDLRSSPLDPAQVAQMRRTVRRMIDQQMGGPQRRRSPRAR